MEYDKKWIRYSKALATWTLPSRESIQQREVDGRTVLTSDRRPPALVRGVKLRRGAYFVDRLS